MKESVRKIGTHLEIYKEDSKMVLSFEDPSTINLKTNSNIIELLRNPYKFLRSDGSLLAREIIKVTDKIDIFEIHYNGKFQRLEL